MNKGRILENDATRDGANASKLLLAIGEERPFGCYSLHFGSFQEMREVAMGAFLGSEHFEEVVHFLGDARRANGRPVLLPGTSGEWVRFLHQNAARLGRDSRPLDPPTSWSHRRRPS